MIDHRRALLIPILGVLLLALAACEGAEVPAENAPDLGEDAETGPMDAEFALDDISLGGRTALSGAIDEGWRSDEFIQGERIYVAMEVGDATAGSDVRVQWIGPDGEVEAEETKEILPGQHYLNFQMPDTVALPLGEYRVRVFYEGVQVEELGFEVRGT